MSFENSFSDPDRLQRLVDGELTVEEVREGLQSLENGSPQWRSIACAFVEDQMFRKELGDYVAQSDPIASNQPQRAAMSPRVSRSILSSLAIAAGVLLMGSLGYLVGSKGAVNQMAHNEERIAEKPTEEVAHPVDLRPEYRMQLLTVDGESLGSEVDLYEYEDLNRLVGNELSEPLTVEKMLPPSGLSADFRQRLSRSGYDVNESTNYMSGRLDDGRAFLVPVRSIRFDRGH